MPPVLSPTCGPIWRPLATFCSRGSESCRLASFRKSATRACAAGWIPPSAPGRAPVDPRPCSSRSHREAHRAEGPSSARRGRGGGLQAERLGAEEKGLRLSATAARALLERSGRSPNRSRRAVAARLGTGGGSSERSHESRVAEGSPRRDRDGLPANSRMTPGEQREAQRGDPEDRPAGTARRRRVVGPAASFQR